MNQLYRQYQAILIALQFLTIIPVRPDYERTPLHASLPWYPLIGFLIGLLLAGLSGLLADTAPAIAASLLLLFWVVLTGALHLDGLADTADAWVGGLGDRERTLVIMKDPCCGPVGVTALILVLLLKFSALQLLLQHAVWSVLVWIPVFARTAVMLFLAYVPYVRVGGLGEALTDSSAQWWIILSLLLVVSVVVVFAGWTGVTLILLSAVVFALLYKLFMQRLQGVTGDMLGATIEVMETVLLCFIAVVLL